MVFQWSERVDIGQVQNESAPRAQLGRGRLRQEQRRTQVAADQIVEGGRGDRAERRRIETRGVVDQHIEAPEGADRGRDYRRDRRDIQQVRATQRSGSRAPAVELEHERTGVALGVAVMDDDVCPLGMQRARDRGAEAPCSPGDQYRLASERCDRGEGHGARIRVGRARTPPP